METVKTYKVLPYNQSLATFVDLYELTMAQTFVNAGLDGAPATFHYFYRSHFEGVSRGGYCIAAGLELIVDWIRNFRFDYTDIDYLRSLKGSENTPLFHEDFLTYLFNLRLSLDLYAMPEGTAAFPYEPIIRIEGSIVQCLLAETALLTLMNSQTFWATKMARCVHGSKQRPVLYFGARRAHGLEAGLFASRGAFIGGAAGTSLTWAGKHFGIPVIGTMAHALVMAFDTEQEAFETYLNSSPDNSTLLVDTYDSIGGVQNAIKVGHELRGRGYDLGGIRLDSGDLATISKRSRALLDSAGFIKAKIWATNDLDEYAIESLILKQDAPIDGFGVGTRMHQNTLGGVYKLATINLRGQIRDKLKMSEQKEKSSIQGAQQVRRFYTRNGQYMLADAIYRDGQPISGRDWIIAAPLAPDRLRRVPADLPYEDLLVPVMLNGEAIYDFPSLIAIQERALSQIKHLAPGNDRLENPQEYFAWIEQSLSVDRQTLLQKRDESNIPMLGT